MEKIYCISGLGADGRVFQKLRIKNYELKNIAWSHYDAHDDMSCYAQKLATQIDNEEPVLIGVSFGGMLAVEIAKQKKIKKAILISSAKTCYELPFVSEFVKTIVDMKIIPVGLFKQFHKQMNERFGATTTEEKKMLVEIMNATDNGFVKWAMKAIVNWRNTQVPQKIIHIHGTEDKMIPSENVKPDFWIKHGTHFMVYNRADEISNIINNQLSQ